MAERTENYGGMLQRKSTMAELTSNHPESQCLCYNILLWLVQAYLQLVHNVTSQHTDSQLQCNTVEHAIEIEALMLRISYTGSTYTLSASRLEHNGQSQATSVRFKGWVRQIAEGVGGSVAETCFWIWQWHWQDRCSLSMTTVGYCCP